MGRRHFRGVRTETVIVLCLTALLTIAPLMPPVAAALPALGIVVLTLLAWHWRAPAAASLGVLAVACVGIGLVGLGPQQIVFTLAFTIYAVVVWRAPWLRGASVWLRRGAFKGSILAFVAGIAVLSAVALLAWYTIIRPDLADLVRTFVPDQPLWLLVPGALLFALLNAAIEEAAYRGVLLGALDATLCPAAAGVFLQAVAFATLHIHGFPRGTPGIGLAFVYGLALGGLRRKAGGLLAPWAAHVLTDIAIFSIVLALARA